MPDIDPYRKWLGIAPKDQPPHHYRLLGIDVFESDPDVVEAAADQRMTYLHGCAAGEYVELGEKLLNEVSAARLELLDPRKKACYDANLRERLAASETLMNNATLSTSEKTLPQPSPKPNVPNSAGTIVATPRNPNKLLVIIGAVAAAVVLIGVIVVVLIATADSGGDEPDAERRDNVASLENEADRLQNGKAATTNSTNPASSKQAIEPEESASKDRKARAVETVSSVEMACWSPDGSRIATAGRDGKVRIWAADTLKLERELVGHEKGVTGCTFVEDGAKLISASKDETARVWDTHTGKQLERIPLPKPVQYLSRSAVGDSVFAGSTGQSFGVNYRGASFVTLPLARPHAYVTTLEPDSKRNWLLFASMEGTIFVWDLLTLEVVKSFRPPEGARKLLVSPDGESLAVGADDGSVFLYDTQEWEVIWRGDKHPHAIASLTFSPDGKYLLSGSIDWTVVVWDRDKGESVKRHWPGPGWVTTLQFSPDGRELLMAIGGPQGKKIEIWPTERVLGN